MTLALTPDCELSQHEVALEQGTMLSVTEGQVRVLPLPLAT
jgi:hypothetical protein